MHTIGSPDVIRTVELEKNEERNENARNPSQVCIDKEIFSGRGEVVVEAIFIDINTEENTAGDEKNVVVDKLLGNGVMEGRRAWGSCIEFAKRMDE